MASFESRSTAVISGSPDTGVFSFDVADAAESWESLTVTVLNVGSDVDVTPSDLAAFTAVAMFRKWGEQKDLMPYRTTSCWKWNPTTNTLSFSSSSWKKIASLISQ